MARSIVVTTVMLVFAIVSLVLRFQDMHLTTPEFAVAHWRLYAAFIVTCVAIAGVCLFIDRKKTR